MRFFQSVFITAVVVLPFISFAQDSLNIRHLGFCDTPNNYRLDVDGNYAYVVAYQAGIRIIDVSDPTAPFEVGFYAPPGLDEPYDVAVAGNYAYIEDYYRGLRIIDVSNPANPVDVGSWFHSSDGRGLGLRGDYAYLANDSGLQIINISNPSSPVALGFFDTPGRSYEAIIDGSYAYVSQFRVIWGIYGVSIIDISNPSNPVGVSFYEGTYNCTDVSGGYAYFSAGVDGMRMIDVSNPSSPVEVGTYFTPGPTSGIDVVDNIAYVLHSGGLRVVNVSDPANPIEIGYYNTPSGGNNIVVKDGLAYVVNGDGLHIYDCTEVTELGNGFVSLLSAGPPDWIYRLNWISGTISRFKFTNFCTGTTGSVSGLASSTGWTATNYTDSIVFSSSIPLTSGSIEAFTLSHPWCDDIVSWQVGDSTGDLDGPLPVELLSFNAVSSNDAISLSFSTASETDNDIFEIWRSEAADNGFEMLTSMSSQGNSATGHHYEYVDRDVETGKTYWYYLADVDINGVRTEHRNQVASATALGSIALPQSYSFGAYPNPFNPTTTISFSLPESGDVRLGVYDLQGRQVRDLGNENYAAGVHRVAFDAYGLPSGVYVAQIVSGSYSASEKLLLLK